MVTSKWCMLISTKDRLPVPQSSFWFKAKLQDRSISCMERNQRQSSLCASVLTCWSGLKRKTPCVVFHIVCAGHIIMHHYTKTWAAWYSAVTTVSLNQWQTCIVSCIAMYIIAQQIYLCQCIYFPISAYVKVFGFREHDAEKDAWGDLSFLHLQ